MDATLYNPEGLFVCLFVCMFARWGGPTADQITMVSFAHPLCRLELQRQQWQVLSSQYLLLLSISPALLSHQTKQKQTNYVKIN
jgi:hypothetical protein